MIYRLSTGAQIYPGSAFTHPDGRQFPGNWYKYTDSEIAGLGITTEADPVRPDSRFYELNGDAKDLATLKTNYIELDKGACAQLLRTTDWYVTRKSENDTAIPADVTTHRNAVRAAQVSRESEVNACADVEALKTLLDAPALVENSEGDFVANSAALTQYPQPL
tara:strand:+ start:3391 stop:3882 length:492 start_codon:yes stop_codon:yes gene_type:complete